MGLIPATNTRGSDSLLLVGCMSKPYLARSRRHSSSDRLLNKFGPIRIGPGALFGAHTFSSDWVELYRGPKAHYLIWGLYPYNSPSKFRFFPSYPRRKRRDFDIYGVIDCKFLFHPCGGTAPRASLLLMAFRNSRGANYCA